MPAPKFLNAAERCLARIAEGKRAKLDEGDRAGMLEELKTKGIFVSAKSDAYVAARYDAEWSEEDHPRGEGGKFGAGAAQGKAEAAAKEAFHGELAHNSGELGAPGHKELGQDFRKAQVAYTAAAAAHRAEGNENLANFHASKAAEQGRVAESHEKAASAEKQGVTGGYAGKSPVEHHAAAAAKNEAKAAAASIAGQHERAKMYAERAQTHAQLAAAKSPNPAADKLTPGAKAAGASEYAKTMSKYATTPEKKIAAAAAHREAAVQQRAVGNDKVANSHDAKASAHEKAAGIGSARIAEKSAVAANQPKSIDKVGGRQQLVAPKSAPVPGEHPAIESRIKRFPVGSEVTTAAPGQMFHGGAGASQHYGTVVGHNRVTGAVHVKFGNGSTRAVDPGTPSTGMNLQRVLKSKGE